MRPNLTGNPLLDLGQPVLDPGQRRIHPLMKKAVMQRDHHICRYCGGFATEVDHVEPWSHGGLTVMANLAAACQRCNREKGDRTPWEWEAAKQQAAVKAALGERLKVRKRPPIKVRPISGHRPKPTLAELLRAS